MFFGLKLKGIKTIKQIKHNALQIEKEIRMNMTNWFNPILRISYCF